MEIPGRKGNEPGEVSVRNAKGIRGATSAVGRQRKAESAGGAAPGAGSSFAVSERGRLFSEASKIADSIPDIRTEKVEEVRDALERGTYRVEGRKVADKMVDAALREIRARLR